ncbi:hypothetical protein [Escherichia coli]|uniref:hypothetical protein n=1 Tax=Escherichia coli TaxID=562 RepID=UPI003890BE02
MNYTALYSTIYRVRNLTRTVAKVLAWALGLQLAILYGLATVADAPLTQLAGPGLRFAAVLAVVILARESSTPRCAGSPPAGPDRLDTRDISRRGPWPPSLSAR